MRTWEILFASMALLVGLTTGFTAGFVTGASYRPEPPPPTLPAPEAFGIEDTVIYRSTICPSPEQREAR